MVDVAGGSEIVSLEGSGHDTFINIESFSSRFKALFIMILSLYAVSVVLRNNLGS
jgi:hypothetical protein